MSYYPPPPPGHPSYYYSAYPGMSGAAPPMAYPMYYPGTVMVPVPIGPMMPDTSNPTYITNHIYHGATEPISTQPALTDGVSIVETTGDHDWLPTTSTLASNLTGRAVVGGHEGWDGSPIWVIRAWHEGGLYPGKLSVRHCSATIPFEGKEVSVQNIEVLCAKAENYRWIPAASGNVPPGAIPAGQTGSGETLYVGRAKYQMSITPGVVIPSKNCCMISFTGLEVSHRIYDVLCRAS